MIAIAILSTLVLVLAIVLIFLARTHIATKNRLVLSERLAAIEAATLKSERDSAKEQLAHYQRSEKERNELVRAEIENLSNRIFEEKTGKFKEIGTVAIADLVRPVKENLEKLQKALAESETTGAVREQSWKAALMQVGQINAQLGIQADNLTKALRSDNKMVGDFGEEILERLLEYSGLQRGINFVEQGVDLDLKTDSGTRLMPDVVIFLPENRCLVVDSKMSLKSWAESQTEDESLRVQALEAFKRSIRVHVDGLASKPYTQSLAATGRGAVDFKFLFIPIESAFHTALQLDRDLYRYAFDKKIILVSPTTLLAVLMTINHTWQQFDIGRNAEAIRDRAAKLLEKLHDFFGSMEKVGEQLGKAQEAYDVARKRLSSGSGNLVRQATMLKDLKIESGKGIPKALESMSSDEDDA